MESKKDVYQVIFESETTKNKLIFIIEAVGMIPAINKACDQFFEKYGIWEDGHLYYPSLCKLYNELKEEEE